MKKAESFDSTFLSLIVHFQIIVIRFKNRHKLF